MNKDLIKNICSGLKKYTPATLSILPIIAMIEEQKDLIRKKRHVVIKVMQKTHSNNWLKTHGYPMRRKKRRRKRS